MIVYLSVVQFVGLNTVQGCW